MQTVSAITDAPRFRMRDSKNRPRKMSNTDLIIAAVREFADTNAVTMTRFAVRSSTVYFIANGDDLDIVVSVRPDSMFASASNVGKIFRLQVSVVFARFQMPCEVIAGSIGSLTITKLRDAHDACIHSLADPTVSTVRQLVLNQEPIAR